MNRAPAMLLLLLLTLAAPGFPQNPGPAGDHPIGVADLLSISVYGVADFTRDLRVSSTGTIRMPFLGELKVVGLMPSQVEAKLAELLHPNFVKDPQVSVLIKEPRSRMFSILGSVMKPGQYQMLEPITLVTAIAGAGGLNLAKAGDAAMIQRTQAAGENAAAHPTALVASADEARAASFQIEVNLKRLLHEGDISLDIPIMPGDVISIPEREAKAFYVIGDVSKPGAFEFPKDRAVRLSWAVAMAGGPTKTSRLKETALIRLNSDGTAKRTTLNIDKVLQGKEPDIELQPNDLVYVPGSVGKQMGVEFLRTLPYAVTSLLRPF